MKGEVKEEEKMQTSAQFGVAEVPPYVMGRTHVFHLSHDLPPAPPPPPPPPPYHHHQLQEQQSSVPSPSLQLHHSQTLLQPNHQQHNQHQPQSLPHASTSPQIPSPLNNDLSTTIAATADQPPNMVDDHDGLVEEGERELIGNRWPRQETLALLKIRSDMDSSFKDATSKGPLWEEVSRKLAQMGYHRNAKKCKEKFENVYKYYKRTKDGKAGRQDGKIYRFFDQLEALYGKVSVGQEKTNGCNVESSNNGGTEAGHSTQLGEEKQEGFVPCVTCTGRGIGESNGCTANKDDDNTDNNNKMKTDLDYSSGLSFSTDQSSEEDYGGESRKRKRRYPALLESLMKKILDKQERMQRRFLQALERRENDRMEREEAWKRQEMARMSREQELRAQERSLAASRDAAIVAFLQKVTGQTLQLPQLALPPPPSTLTTLNAPPTSELIVHGSQHHPPQDDLAEGPPQPDCSSKRWPKAEVLALIKLRSGLSSRFHEPGLKGHLWDEISANLASLGYHRSPKRCKEKWENINKYFKKAKESNKRRPENAKTCPYFHHLDSLYGNGLLNSNQHRDGFSQELLPRPASHDPAAAQLHGGDEIMAANPSENAPPNANPNSTAIAASQLLASNASTTKQGE